MTWTTKELQDYLAGDASAEMALQIEADLAADTALEDRLMALDPMASAVKEAAQMIVAPAAAQKARWIPTPDADVQGKRFDWRHLAAAAVLGAAVTGAAWTAQSSVPTPDWRAQVATYQALYSADTIAAIAVDDAALTTQVAEVGALVNFNNLHEVIESVDEMSFLRAQILAHEDQPLAQIVFATTNGEPVALCLIAKGNSAHADMMIMEDRAGLSSASFDTATHSWLLIGTQDDALITRTARKVVDQLAALEAI